jgi:hypothetical protein
MLLRHSVSVALILGLASTGLVAQDSADVLNAGVKAVAVATTETEAAPAAAITGMIKVEGKLERIEPVDLSSDPHCVELHGEESTMSNPIGVIRNDDGGLKDVFIQLTRNVPDKKYDRPDEPVVIDQIGCTYTPHVWGVMKKQDILIKNSDATLHNIHALPKSNKEFNLAMPNKGDERTQKFKKAEDAVKIKCDVHPWMATFAFVLEHPYFAVSGADGSFTLPTADLPDGDYGVKIWHEVLGEAEGTVKVAGGAGTFEHVFETGKE